MEAARNFTHPLANHKFVETVDRRLSTKSYGTYRSASGPHVPNITLAYAEGIAFEVLQ